MMRSLLTAIACLALLPVSGDETPAWAAIPDFAAPPPPSEPAESTAAAGSTGETAGTQDATSTGQASGTEDRVEWHAPLVLASIYAEAGVSGIPQMGRYTPLWLEWRNVESEGYEYVDDAELRERMADILRRAQVANDRRERMRARRRGD